MNKLEFFKKIHADIASNLNNSLGICLLISEQHVLDNIKTDSYSAWKDYNQILDYFKATRKSYYFKYVLFGKQATPIDPYWWACNPEGNTMRLCYVREIIERLQFKVDNPNPSWLDLIKLELQQFRALLKTKTHYENILD